MKLYQIVYLVEKLQLDHQRFLFYFTYLMGFLFQAEHCVENTRHEFALLQSDGRPVSTADARDDED